MYDRNLRMSEFKVNTAILLLVFNRPKATVKVLDSIRQVRPPRIYVSADGPRSYIDTDQEKILSVRKCVLENIDWDCEMRTCFHDRNLGCGLAVSSAINWFFKHELEGIILEDDCIPSISFFRFAEDMLIRYRSDTRVMSIAGTNIQSHEPVEFSYIFSKFSLMWGWATWRRAWKLYDYHMLEWPRLRQTKWLYSIGLGTLYFRQTWTLNFDNTCSGNVDTWDYQWIYTCWREHGLTILPSVNLVQNIGFGSDATHTQKKHPLFMNLEAQQMTWPLQHPTQIEVSYESDRFIAQNWFGGSRIALAKALLALALRNIWRIFNKISC